MGGFGGGGSAWVLIILFALIFGNGFGVNGNGGALTEAQMCNMSNFTQLENAVGRLADNQFNQSMMLQRGLCDIGYQNLKITTREDLYFAEAILRMRREAEAETKS